MPLLIMLLSYMVLALFCPFYCPFIMLIQARNQLSLKGGSFSQTLYLKKPSYSTNRDYVYRTCPTHKGACNSEQTHAHGRTHA